MVKRAVSEVENGERLLRDVRTPRGNTLFRRGTVIRDREREILNAFLIDFVETDAEEKEEPQQSDYSRRSIYMEYDQMLHMLKHVFKNAAADDGQLFPLMDVRKQLQQLLSCIQEYNVLSFRPPRFEQEDYLFHNSILVGMTSFLLAQWYGCSNKDLFPIAIAGLLHNIGNMKLDPELLAKRTELTTQEKEEIRKHPILGYNILKNVQGLNEGIKLAALQHHEKMDGSGYPFGIKGDKIHLYAKVVAVADIFHAMTNDRNYRLAESPYLVLEQLYNESFGKLDPALVQTFIVKLTQLHNGARVRLSDQTVGEIVFTDRDHPTRPWVKVNGRIINLTEDRSIHILEVIQ